MAVRYSSVPRDDLEDDNVPPAIAINVDIPPIDRTTPIHVLVRFNDGADVGLMVNTTDKLQRVKEMVGLLTTCTLNDLTITAHINDTRSQRKISSTYSQWSRIARRLALV